MTDEEGREVGGEVNEASLAITRKIILCSGLLVGALFFLYPHWRVTVELGYVYCERDLGRAFVTAPPLLDPDQFVSLSGLGAKGSLAAQVQLGALATYRIHRIRQLTEVALALLFTIGLMRVLKKPAGD